MAPRPFPALARFRSLRSRFGGPTRFARHPCTAHGFGSRRALRATRALLSATALAVAMAAALSACPPKELLIDISAEGVGYIVKACSKPCSSEAPKCCDLHAGQKESSRPLAFQLALLTRNEDGERSIRARSKCIELPIGCAIDEQVGGPGYCLQVQMNERIREHLSDGLGFDGMDPSETEVIMTIHRAPALLDLSGHEIPDSADPTECVPEHLFACAALENTGEAYDIVCASCDGQTPIMAIEFDVEEIACFGHCFVQACYHLLGQAIADGR